MSENVIEKLVEKWRPSKNRGCFVAAAHQRCADELRAATDPRQFMPRLDEWPEDAEWIKLLEGCLFVFMSGSDESLGTTHLTIPPGIDPRIKISREQMEAWENSDEHWAKSSGSDRRQNALRRMWVFHVLYRRA